jgi:Fe2+ or Zn2+ uptake regulation protein
METRRYAYAEHADLSCLDCGRFFMVTEDRKLTCPNSQCEHHGIKFDIPRVLLYQTIEESNGKS